MTDAFSGAKVPGMKLGDYLEDAGVTQAQFAKDLGVSQGLVSQWISETTAITPERAMQIDTLTEGRVSKSDLRPDIWGE